MARMELPAEALDWLAVWRGVRGLVLAGDLGLPRRLTAAGHTLFALTDDVTLAGRLGALDKVTPLVARPEAIPADPCQFEVAFAHQNLHRFDLSQALPQLARVLRPGGCLSASYLVRDDTVPWVRRLAAVGDVLAVQRVARHRLERADLLARIPPMLGLMATIIPLGPGLAALGQGNPGELASAVTVAFDATVLGLVAGIGGLVVGKLRRRWYEELLEGMEQAE